MPNLLTNRIREVLIPKLGKFLTESAIRTNCQRINIAPEELKKSQLPEFTKNLRVTLTLFLKEEEVEQVLKQLREITLKPEEVEKIVPSKKFTKRDLDRVLNTATQRLQAQIKELNKVKLGLEERVKAKTQALEEERATLEIKIKARTKELEELTKGLEEKVQARTKEIEKRTKELEESGTALINILEDTEESRKEAEEKTKEVERKAEELKTQTEALEESRAALMNILEDVEDARKAAEQERDKTKAIITNFADGLIVLDGENKITLINPEGERLLKVKAKEVESKSLKTLITKPSIKKLAELIKTKENEESLFRKELSLKKPNERVLELTSISLAPREENVIILHDISREKLIERMKTEFVSLAAHQLRTPLSGIKWTLRMLLDGDLGEISQEQRDFIEKTYKSNERMISLVNDLLNVTRIEEGKYLYRPVFTQIENVVKFVINSFREQTQRKNIKFSFKKPEKKLPKVKVDVEKIRLVMSNLIDNAIRYTPAGGRVTVALNYGKKEIEFSVKDTGVGIPEDQKKQVFTKFFRGANVIRLETEGTGLGLFIGQNIIKAHGGKVWFESEEGKGTTFYFTLPVKKELEEFLKEF